MRRPTLDEAKRVVERRARLSAPPRPHPSLPHRAAPLPAPSTSAPSSLRLACADYIAPDASEEVLANAAIAAAAAAPDAEAERWAEAAAAAEEAAEGLRAAAEAEAAAAAAALEAAAHALPRGIRDLDAAHSYP